MTLKRYGNNSHCCIRMELHTRTRDVYIMKDSRTMEYQLYRSDNGNLGWRDFTAFLFYFVLFSVSKQTLLENWRVISWPFYLIVAIEKCNDLARKLIFRNATAAESSFDFEIFKSFVEWSSVNFKYNFRLDRSLRLLWLVICNFHNYDTWSCHNIAFETRNFRNIEV